MAWRRSSRSSSSLAVGVVLPVSMTSRVQRHWHRRQNPRRARYQALIAPQPCIRSILRGSHHDAIMRIGGELRGGGSILDRGLRAIVKSESPPPRIVIGRPPPRPAKTVVLLSDLLPLRSIGYDAG